MDEEPTPCADEGTVGQADAETDRGFDAETDGGATGGVDAETNGGAGGGVDAELMRMRIILNELPLHFGRTYE